MLWLMFLLSATPAQADTLVATRTIRAQSQIAEADLALVAGFVPGALDRVAAAVGMEARVTLYPGRPIREADVGPVTIINRNQLVTINYAYSGLHISAEGRALGRGGAGDVVRVMNLNSRNTVSGRVREDGIILVGPQR